MEKEREKRRKEKRRNHCPYYARVGQRLLAYLRLLFDGLRLGEDGVDVWMACPYIQRGREQGEASDLSIAEL